MLPQRAVADVDVRVFGLLPDPMLLLRGTTILSVTKAAVDLLHWDRGEVEGKQIQSLVSDVESAQRYLALCARSRELLPGAIDWRDASGGSRRLRCDGAVLEAADGAHEPLVMLRIRPVADASERFIVLSERVEGLTREIRRRQQAEEKLQALARTLEQRVLERTLAARNRADQLRALTATLVQTEHRERRRLAQVLHDDLQQLLVAAKMRSQHIGSENKPMAQAAIDDVGSLINEALELSRSMTIELSPPVLYDAGLGPALLWLQRWMKQRFDLEVEVLDDHVDQLPETLRLLIFEAVRELLFNVVKHAGTSRARVSVSGSPDDLRVVVEDWGRGMQPAQERTGQSGSGGGTRIEIRIEAQAAALPAQADDAPVEASHSGSKTRSSSSSTASFET